MERLAAFDIGSNAVRMLTADWDQKGCLAVCKRIRIPLRLGSQSFSQGYFSDYLIDQAATIFEGLKNLMEREHITRYRAVATSAYREARNSEVMGEKIFRRSGIRIEAISGTVEGEIIFNAIKRKVDLRKKNFLVIDIGGGSLELAIVKKGDLTVIQSFNVGTVRVLRDMKKEKDVVKKIFEKEGIGGFVKNHFSNNESVRVVGTGGNYRRILKLRGKLFGKKMDYILPEELSYVHNCLAKYTVLQRMKKFGLKRDRADVILPALIISKMVVKELNVKKIYCPDIGLGHGILCGLVGDKLTRLK